MAQDFKATSSAISGEKFTQTQKQSEGIIKQ